MLLTTLTFQFLLAAFKKSGHEDGKSRLGVPLQTSVGLHDPDQVWKQQCNAVEVPAKHFFLVSTAEWSIYLTWSSVYVIACLWILHCFYLIPGFRVSLTRSSRKDQRPLCRGTPRWTSSSRSSRCQCYKIFFSHNFHPPAIQAWVFSPGESISGQLKFFSVHKT